MTFEVMIPPPPPPVAAAAVAVAAAPQPTIMEVQCPAGAGPGATITITDPSGQQMNVVRLTAGPFETLRELAWPIHHHPRRESKADTLSLTLVAQVVPDSVQAGMSFQVQVSGGGSTVQNPLGGAKELMV